MTKFDDRMRPLAEKMVALYGKAVVLQSIEQSDDYASGAESVHYVNYDAVGVVQAPSRYLYQMNLAQLGDTMLLLGDMGLGVAPKIGDRVDFSDGEAPWSVMSVQTTYSGDLPVLHTLLLRRS